MPFLTKSLSSPNLFHASIPNLPMGKYAHFVILRETDSFSLFQTDEQLNFAKVRAGRVNKDVISRIVMFKRKQTTPERLTGRELLRRYDLISGDAKNARYCEYNSQGFCKKCPDCIFYGFAIGQEGSERSKIMVDSAYSLSNYDESHQAFTFNAPYESGTMSKEGVTTSRFGEQDHVLPQVVFPSVVTVHDPTEAEFLYVLNNILRTKRYGAQTTRTGTIENHLAAVVFTDGEIFSNLKLTQTLYDYLEAAGKPTKAPYNITDLLASIETNLENLLKEDGVSTQLQLSGIALRGLVEEVLALVANEANLSEFLTTAYAESEKYATTYGAKTKEKGSARKS